MQKKLLLYFDKIVYSKLFSDSSAKAKFYDKIYSLLQVKSTGKNNLYRDSYVLPFPIVPKIMIYFVIQWY